MILSVKGPAKSSSWESIAPAGIGRRELSCVTVYRRGLTLPPVYPGSVVK